MFRNMYKFLDKYTVHCTVVQLYGALQYEVNFIAKNCRANRPSHHICGVIETQIIIYGGKCWTNCSNAVSVHRSVQLACSMLQLACSVQQSDVQSGVQFVQCAVAAQRAVAVRCSDEWALRVQQPPK